MVILHASQKEKYDGVTCLLSSIEDINFLDDDGKSPLFVASQKGKCDVVKCLLNSGITVSIV
jgi:ankyrin repeat protein